MTPDYPQPPSLRQEKTSKSDRNFHIPGVILHKDTAAYLETCGLPMIER